MQLFEELADRVEVLLKSNSFSEAAASALREYCPASHTSAEEIVSWALEAKTLPRQRDMEASFGDPPITLVNRENFHIQFLLWREGSAAVHHHAFSGAFSVVAGTSLHSRYSFTADGNGSAEFTTGTLQFRECEYLEPGDVREIVAGNSMIHSVFHLGSPSATIVVRTHHEECGSPQLAYTPDLAFDPFVSSPSLRRKLQLLKMMPLGCEEDERALLVAVGQVLDTEKLATGFIVLRQYARRVGHVRDLHSLLQRVDTEEGGYGGPIRTALESLLAESNIVSRRQILQDPEHRLFLALLLNIPNREAILGVLDRIFDEEPAFLLAKWLREIAALSVPPQWGASALGVPLNEGALEFLAGILRGENVDAALAGCRDHKNAAIAALTLPRSGVLAPLFC